MNTYSVTDAGCVTLTPCYQGPYGSLPTPYCPKDTPKEDVYLDRLVEGISDTLRREEREKEVKQEILIEEALANNPTHKALIEMELAYYRFKAEDEYKSFWRISNDKKIELLELKAYKLLLAYDPTEVSYPATSTVYNARHRVISSVRASFRTPQAPDRDQIKALLITIPKLETKSFQELLDLTRKTFM